MRCKDFEVRLQEVLDERECLESDSELAAHVHLCARCRALAEAYDTLFVGLAASDGAELETNLTDRVLVELAERDTHRRRPRDRRLTVAGWAAAAVVAIALVPLLRGNPSIWSVATVAPRSVVAEVRSSSAALTQLPAAAPSSDLRFLELPAEEYTDLGRETGRSVAALVRCLPRLNLDSLAELSTAELRGQSASMSGVTGDVEPFTSSMAEAWQMILEMPSAKPSPPADSRAS